MSIKENAINKLKSIRVCGDKSELWNFEAGTILSYIEKLEHKLKQVKEYIEEEMYVDENPTICGGEEEFYKELPISLNLYNEDLRKLLELLEVEK